MDSTVEITRNDPQIICPFILTSSPSTSSSLIWYTCRNNGGRLVLTIEGQATLEEYMILLQSVTYSIRAQEPDKDTLRRTIAVSLNYQ